jgi:hypothetical protein
MMHLGFAATDHARLRFNLTTSLIGTGVRPNVVPSAGGSAERMMLAPLAHVRRKTIGAVFVIGAATLNSAAGTEFFHRRSALFALLSTVCPGG